MNEPTLWLCAAGALGAVVNFVFGWLGWRPMVLTINILCLAVVGLFGIALFNAVGYDLLAYIIFGSLAAAVAGGALIGGWIGLAVRSTRRNAAK